MAALAYHLRICGDCLQVIANGADSLELEPERVAEISAGLARQPGTVAPACDPDCEGGFSWQPCELCESPLGGDRHKAAVLCDGVGLAPLDSPDSESWAEAQGELT